MGRWVSILISKSKVGVQREEGSYLPTVRRGGGLLIPHHREGCSYPTVRRGEGCSYLRRGGGGGSSNPRGL